LAVAILRTQAFPSWVAWLWILAVVVALPAFFLPELETLFFAAGGVAFGLGFLGAGYLLWREEGGSR
jgi:hypothetical protein